MRAIRRAISTFAFGLVVVVAGCSDVTSPTDPIVAEPSEGLLGNLLLNPGPVQVLTRTTPLAQDYSVTETVGPNGGIIRIPEAGLLVAFPRWAVRSPTQITVTAPAGDLVGYHFQPHGLEFRRSVAVVQNLNGTNAPGLFGGLGSSMRVAYFQGPLNPVVTALEILPLDVLGWLNLGFFRIDHFSGYVIATD